MYITLYLPELRSGQYGNRTRELNSMGDVIAVQHKIEITSRNMSFLVGILRLSSRRRHIRILVAEILPKPREEDIWTSDWYTVSLLHCQTMCLCSCSINRPMDLLQIPFWWFAQLCKSLTGIRIGFWSAERKQDLITGWTLLQRNTAVQCTALHCTALLNG
jgi:hypothetical protein